MRSAIFAVVLSVFSLNGAWAAEPSLLVYMSPEQYRHPTVVGISSLYTRWVEHTVIAEDAAIRALAGQFSAVGACEAGKSADVIAWVKPRLVYNPVSSTYYAKLKVQFHLGDGSPLATYKAEGHHDGALTSAYVDSEVGLAFDDAMRQIMAQLHADITVQANIQKAIAADFTRSPCGIVAVLGRESNPSFFEF